MKIEKRCYTPHFSAKFIQSDDLKRIADYAVERGKFDKLNQARKNIDNSFLRRKIYVDIGKNEKDKSYINFTVFEPKKEVVVPVSNDDYVQINTKQYVCEQKSNPLAFALRKIIKLGNNAPNNKMYQDIMKKS